MGSRFLRSLAAATALVMAVSTVTLADPPGGVPGNGGGATSTDTSGGQSTATQPGCSGSSCGVGQLVSAKVQAALAAGTSGTALANAVHGVILSEKPNAKGLTVAMAVYDRLSSGASQTGTGSGTPALAFSDLSQAPWANDAVDALKQAGVVNGTGPDQFSPDDPVTQAELATMLARLQAGSAVSGTQVPAGTPSWAQGGMGWAVSGAVLSGVQGLGAPDDPLTRAQAVSILLNAAGVGSVAGQAASEPIGLSGDVPGWAHGALALAIDLGILQGSSGQLLADQPLTRAQMAVLLARLAVLEAQATTLGG